MGVPAYTCFMRIHLCQCRPTLGDVENNLAKVQAEVEAADADIIVFPELFLVGYPAFDAVFDNGAEAKFTLQLMHWLKILCIMTCYLLLGPLILMVSIGKTQHWPLQAGLYSIGMIKYVCQIMMCFTIAVTLLLVIQ